MPKSTTTARGYRWKHQQARERYAALVARGLAVCARCGRPIAAGAPFDLDHSEDRDGYIEVSHRSCNRSAGARKANGQGDAQAGPMRCWSRNGMRPARRRLTFG